MSLSISKVHGREVLDSRGNPTVEVELELSDGSFGSALVPSGASKGEHEAIELRDGDAKRFFGKGVTTAVQNVNSTIRSRLINNSFEHIGALDAALIELDGTEQKSKLGANAILGVSMAFADALAVSRNFPLYRVFSEAMGVADDSLRLPVPLMNILNGGEHANNPLEIQEFMIVPHGFESFRQALRAGTEIFHTLKKKLDTEGYSTSVGDEGGFAPDLSSNEQAIEFICDSIVAAGYELGKQVSFALDVAASSFYQKSSGTYKFKLDGASELSSEALMAYYAALIEKYPLISIEDGLDENDWKGWEVLTQKFGNSIQLVGDDLFVTNQSFVQKGIDNKVANAVLVKVNQIGSLSETFKTMKLAFGNNYRCVVSHRSGETEDTAIAHLAVGSGCGQIKTGSLSRSERIAKYNELLRIEDRAEALGRPIRFASF